MCVCARCRVCVRVSAGPDRAQPPVPGRCACVRLCVRCACVVRACSAWDFVGAVRGCGWASCVAWCGFVA
eukprot:6988480-Prymnesium_polylepis.1